MNRKPYRTWLATFVRRWHSNPDLCHTVDPNGGHSARVALLLLHFFPDVNRGALIGALCHDLGEIRTGDMPAPTKGQFPGIAMQLEMFQADEVRWQGFPNLHLTKTQKDQIDLCDKLDAYLWAEKHAPALIQQEDWRVARGKLITKAWALGVGAEVEGVLGDNR